MARKDYVIFSIASGLVALVTFAFPAQVIGVFSGLVGASPSRVLYELNLGPALAKDARSRLVRPLTSPEIQELKTAIHECAKPISSLFCSIVEKYAMMGEVHAQLAMGTMLDGQYAGYDKSQRVDWLKVAFAQGGLEIFKHAIAQLQNSNQIAGDQGNGQAETLTMSSPNQGSYPTPQNGWPLNNPFASMPPPGQSSAYDETLRQVLLERAMQPNPQTPIFQSATNTMTSMPQISDSGQSQPTRILTPAGPQTYVDQNGAVYAGAGPHGVVNTQTGEFSPTN